MHNIAAVYDVPDMISTLARPLVLALVAAGFPSPADDHLDRDLDLHELLISTLPQPTTSASRVTRCRVSGCTTAIYLIVDRSLEPKHTDIVIAVLNGELTVKRLFKQGLLGSSGPRMPVTRSSPSRPTRSC